MKIEKFAAIDIGSNALRVLVANVFTDKNGHVDFYKNSLIRVPVRLGQDTFTLGEITNGNIRRIIKAINIFKNIIRIHKVTKYKAYATSALREARNCDVIVELIKNKTGIMVELIDGVKEASLISSVRFFENIDKKLNFLYVDVGGGSTELSIISNGIKIQEKSFKIGSVRLLNNYVDSDIWDEIKDWIKENTNGIDDLFLIGTGGNINKIYKITSSKNDNIITLNELKNFKNIIYQLSYSERIIKYQLNPDRADVILPALKIYLNVLKWSGASKILVPRIGLSDGIIQELIIKKLQN
ncbi:MAG: exopolyphosphatase [Flavobacteriaceae bacterium]|nr:exopolyphosphatase [Flavobacteriaceae bacterium]